MKYSVLYKDINEKLADAIGNMWFKGAPDALNSFKALITNKEPLVSLPIFQTIFPWKQSPNTFGEHASELGLLKEEFVQALSSIPNHNAFPTSRLPFTHQTESWRAMLDHKSIVVTSGTGSGKTECFMVPVLQDLANNPSEGIQAIFLYPLNALMSDQQDRMHEWCKALSPQISYAIYNGDTPETQSPAERKEALPQLISRTQIRETPPQILFTNPTMLNYMMIRNADANILRVSREHKSLRWILLDEAHTYTGSSATELALQIRRLIDAFGVDIKDVNFAVTSATISGDSDGDRKKLLDMVCKLTGKANSDIYIIDGERIVPALNTESTESRINEMNHRFQTHATLEQLLDLRKNLNNVSSLSLLEICESLSYEDLTTIHQLELIDFLGEKVDGLGADGSQQALLPTRIHLFVRAIDGLYTCTNDKCNHGLSGSHIWDNMTTFQQAECPECGSPMLEIVSCNNCREILLTGEDGMQGYHMAPKSFRDEFELFDQDLEDENDNTTIITSRFFLSEPCKCVRENAEYETCGFEPQSKEIESYDMMHHSFALQKSFIGYSGNDICPSCGKGLSPSTVKSYFMGAPFLGTLLADILLQQAEECNSNNPDIIHMGQKYITFTDSRSATAKSAMNSNLDVENRWTMTFVYHKMLEKGLVYGRLDSDQQMLYDLLKNSQKDQLLQEQRNKLNELEKERLSYSIRRLSWEELISSMDAEQNFTILYNHLAQAKVNRYKVDHTVSADNSKKAYLNALLLSQFNRIPKYGNTLETLGLIHLVYPGIDGLRSPMPNKFTDSDWKVFLKACVDYYVRDGYYYNIPSDACVYFPQGGYSNMLFSANTTLVPSNTDKSVHKWPSLTETQTPLSESQGRLIHYAAILLGCSSYGQLNVQDVNTILALAWKDLTSHVLTRVYSPDNNPCNYGYKLDFTDSRKVNFELLDYSWICPVEKAHIDILLKGYSPRVKGFLNEENFSRYHVGGAEAESIPFFPYPFMQDSKTGNRVSSIDVQNWADEHLIPMKEQGIYSDILMDIINFKQIYLTSEHSAQIDSRLRKQSVDKFKAGELNVLACSTTMEMGVDLSGISEVVMNTVPPKPANYLQRAGRAGRREESQALALTFCSSTPVGMMAWSNPGWPLDHNVQMPQLKMESKKVIQRNVNSQMLASYLMTIGGLGINYSISDFFENVYESFRAYLSELLIPNSRDYNLAKNRYENLCRGTALEKEEFESSVSFCRDEIERIYKIFDEYINQFKQALEPLDPNSVRFKVISRHLEKYESIDFLSYFAENNFIPSAGIPIGLIEFHTNNYLHTDAKFPSKHISAAISEYAPGCQVVVNEWCYKSAGIGLKSVYSNADVSIIQRCNDCGYTTLLKGNHNNRCPYCHSTNLTGVFRNNNDHFTKVVEPAYFCVDSNDKAKRNLRTQKIGYVSPVLLRMQPWQSNTNQAKYMLRSSEDIAGNELPEILFYNRGANGSGYALCPYCGKMESEMAFGDNYKPNLMKDHKRLDDNTLCEGNGHVHNNVVLVGSNQTDFVEMQFFNNNGELNSNLTLLYTLGEIFTRELASLLGVNQGEISYGVNKDYHSLFIYDTAIGGAGYSTLFRDYKEQIFDSALRSLETCTCHKACTKCLIDRYSQWHIDYLDRKVAIDWLREEKCRRTAPEKISKEYPEVFAITSDFKNTVAEILSSSNVRNIFVFLSDDVTKWNPSTFYYHSLFSRYRGRISYLINSIPNLNLLPANSLASVINILMDRIPFSTCRLNNMKFTPLLLVEKEDSQFDLYFSDDASNNMSSVWGEGKMYHAIVHELPEYKDVSKLTLLDTLKDQYTALHFQMSTKKFKTSQMLSELINASGDSNKWTRINTAIANKDVKVIYTDKFLNSPFATYLLMNLISQVVKKFNLKLTMIELNLGSCIGGGNNNTTEFEGPFISLKKQEEVVETYCRYFLDNISPSIVRNRISQHERDIIFLTEQYEFVILPNGGIGWGLQKDIRSNVNTGVTKITDISSNTNLDVYMVKDSITYTVVMKEKAGQ